MMVSIEVTIPFGGGPRFGLENDTVIPLGSPFTESVTGLLKPLNDCIVTVVELVRSPVVCVGTNKEFGATDMVK
jgi:hypothetical protein